MQVSDLEPLILTRAVGVSRTSGMNWSRGYKTYRHGQVVGFVPPLDRLAVREVRVRYLNAARTDQRTRTVVSRPTSSSPSLANTTKPSTDRGHNAALTRSAPHAKAKRR